MTVPRCLALSVAALAAIGAAGCEETNKFVPPPPPRVSVAQPVVREVADTIEFVGNTAAAATVDLRARVNGYLREIRFEDGAFVNEGDVLFIIDQAPFIASLDIAKANVARADANLKLKQTEYRRIEPLVARNAVTQSEADQAATEVLTAQANLAVANAELRQAQLNLDYTEIKAPISGRIGRHLVDRGNLVQAEQTVLARIETLDPIHAYFNLSEDDLLRFMEMLRAEELPNPEENPPRLFLRLANEQGYPHEGRLDFREFGVDPTSGTALRRGVFKNPDNVLLPGLFVRIRAPIGDPKPRLLVAQRAIGTDQRGNYLLVVNDQNVVEYRLVRLGISIGPLRVVHEGVSEREWVVVNGLQRARPGATVDPERVPMSPPAGTAKEAPAPAAKEGSEPSTPSDAQGKPRSTENGQSNSRGATAEPLDSETKAANP